MSSFNNSVAVATSTASSFSSWSPATIDAPSIGKFPKKLFLHVSPLTTSAGLYHFAEQFGPVAHVNIPVDCYQQSQGFAYITFVWHEHAAVALAQLDGVCLDGVILQPSWAMEDETAAAPTRKMKNNKQATMKNTGGGPRSVATTIDSLSSCTAEEAPTQKQKLLKKKLFLDISPATTATKLTELLAEQKCGPVSQVYAPIHPEKNQQSRGFAFVTFRWHEDAAAALEELDGCILDGMVLRPRWAAPRAPSSAAKKQSKNKEGTARRSK